MLPAAIANVSVIALVIALSPLPLVACIIAAGSDNRANGPAFAAGWVAGLAPLAALAAGAAGGASLGSVSPDAWIQLLIGVALLAVALRSWIRRPRGDVVPQPPAWMSSLDRSPARTFGIGVALAVVNPKHLAATAAAAATLQYHDLSTRGAAVAAAAFLAVASSTVVAVVLAALLGGHAADRALGALERFMLRHSTSVLTVLLAAIGAKLVYEGAAILLR